MSASDMTSNCSHCLICLKKSEFLLNRTDHLGHDDLGLERQISVIYLVNKLLQIPSEVCGKYLSKFGNPEEWISICADCSSFVDEGRQIFNQIQTLKQQHRTIREGLRFRMKNKSNVEENGLILGQPIVEIRHYLDTLDALKAEKDLSIEKNCGWLNVDANLEEDAIDKQLNSENRSGIEQNNCNSRPKESAPKIGSYFLEKQFSFKEDEVKLELILEENEEIIENFENEDSFGESDNDSFNIKDHDSVWQSKNSKSGCLRSSKKEPAVEKHIVEFHKKTEVDMISSQDEIDGEPLILSFAQVVEKHEELAAKAELESNQEFGGQRLNSIPSLARLALVHKVKEFPCQVCYKLYNSFQKWDKHYNGKKGICRKKAARKKRDGLSVSVPVAVQRLACDEAGCDAVFSDLRGLENHLRSNHFDDEGLRCKGCSNIYNVALSYEKHYSQALASDPNSHCAQNGLKCGTGRCALVRSSHAALELHRKVYHGPNAAPRFKCLRCGELFTHRSALKRHIAAKHDPSSVGRYPCPRSGCGVSFKLRMQVKQHLDRYHGPKEGAEKKFKCGFENCKAAYCDKRQLNAHLKIHNPQNQYVCEVCGKGFKLKNYLRIHSFHHDPKLRDKLKLYRKNQVEKKLKLRKEELTSK